MSRTVASKNAESASAARVAAAPAGQTAAAKKTAKSAPLAGDPLWYKDSVVYQTHVKAFFDSNNDGIGDFSGLIEKLDYIRDLGVTAIWLLPFYPSPLRDDGYDIQEYRQINTAYGSMSDVRRLIKEAHARGLRLITELVINHTSDQHVWFQRSRAAKPGSKWRNYYVWSDNDQRYQDTRIIFLDTEKSNWSWDPVAKAYYWHRFYSHQPDLNFDNPQVVEEVIAVMHFWFRMGVDGLRLDAVPYLIEREGTNCENLPETHAVLRRIRAEVDAHFPDRLLLAEANQWPEDTRPYFGDGDECHMAFHFPLMPRMYLGLAREDRHPITDIMRQTPDIPANCQWAIFLRNHDELTLEMVTQSERDYLWDTYAADRRMRINLGIRRRLAPLMGNDRRKIELMNSMLLSMPGTPVLYYGDEIGMGDNVYLGDRDGVRTPMQWSPDRNGGFSRANPQQTYLPAIMDPVYGFQAINVEAQLGNPSSLLNWMRRLISVRNQHQAFGRGTLRFLYPGNRKVLAYLREHEGQTLLCVVNLSRHAQALELDLMEFEGRVPVELLGQHPFPPIGELPYLLTLPGHGFYWFALAAEADAPGWHQALPDLVPDLQTLVTREGVAGLAGAPHRGVLEKSVLPAFLAAQRWYAHKDSKLLKTELGRCAVLGRKPDQIMLAEVVLGLQPDDSRSGSDGTEDDQRAAYWVPFSLVADSGDRTSLTGAPLLPFTMARVRSGPRLSALVDATIDPAFARLLMQQLVAGSGEADADLVFSPTPAMAQVAIGEAADVRRITSEQSNTSLVVDNKVILKLYRQARSGRSPELEISRFLTERTGFANTPPLLGTVTWRDDTAVAAAYAFVPNQGDGWQFIHDGLERDVERMVLSQHTGDVPVEADALPIVAADFAAYTEFAAIIGKRTGELHAALASATGPDDFAPEPVQKAQLKRWQQRASVQRRQALTALKRIRPSLDESTAASVDSLLAHSAELDEFAHAPMQLDGQAFSIRIHGDFHLGQVLVVPDDCMILDFEGEPSRTVAQRLEKGSPFQDLAGMLRSFDYAAQSVVLRLSQEHPSHANTVRDRVRAWRSEACRAFLNAWRMAATGSAAMPAELADANRLLRHFLMEKALYEAVYEAANRPRWVGIPVAGLLELLDAEGASYQLESGDAA